MELECECGNRKFNIQKGNDWHPYFFVCTNCKNVYFLRSDINELWAEEGVNKT